MSEERPVISTIRDDIDLNDQTLGLKIAAERLSIVRYVFLVQIEDGIASASQRASLEYADAVLIGWPETDSPDVVELDAVKLKTVREQMGMMEQYIRRFSAMERKGDVDGMTDTLIRITERVAEVRRLYQPGFPLPTFAEIRRVVQDEWDEDMGKIDPQEANTTADQGKRETDEADSQRSRRHDDAKAATGGKPIGRRSRPLARNPISRRAGAPHVGPVIRKTGRSQAVLHTRQLAHAPARRHHGRNLRPDPQRPPGRRLGGGLGV